jgi:hypothetical protein
MVERCGAFLEGRPPCRPGFRGGWMGPRWHAGGLGADGAASGAFESVLNAGCIFQITKEFSVQPDIQYIIRPEGFGQTNNALVLAAPDPSSQSVE